GSEEQRAEEEDREQPVAVERPAEKRERAAHDDEQRPGLQDVAEREHRAQVSSSRSSSSPRGGQSGSGASQRLEQWSEAMFCSGIRMCPFSSMWATSSTRQYAVSTPSW